MHSAIETLGLDRLYAVHPGNVSWPLGEKIQALGLGANDDDFSEQLRTGASR